MTHLKTSLIALALTASSAPLFVACELDKEACSLNTDCGRDFLCRSNECRPRCNTYLTCAEGEACMDGACVTPAADFCEFVAPTLAPDSGLYLPCPVVGGDEASGGSTGGSTAGTSAEVTGGSTGGSSAGTSVEVTGGSTGGSTGGAPVEVVGGSTGSSTGGAPVEVVGGSTGSSTGGGMIEVLGANNEPQ